MMETQAIKKAVMRYFIMTIAVLAWPLSLLPLAHALPSDEAKFFYEEASGPTDEELSSGVLLVRSAYSMALSSLERKYMDAFDKQYVFSEILKEGMQGDIYALAMASVLPHVDPEFSEGIDVSPIKPWLVRHLGEAESHWLLGVFYLHWLSGSPPLRHAPVYVNAPKHFRKAPWLATASPCSSPAITRPRATILSPRPGPEAPHAGLCRERGSGELVLEGAGRRIGGCMGQCFRRSSVRGRSYRASFDRGQPHGPVLLGQGGANG